MKFISKKDNYINMNLLNLLGDGSQVPIDWSIEKILSIAGDGNLRDKSRCSDELRLYFSRCSLNDLLRHSQRLLYGKEKLDCGGFLLQDLINEIGRRIGFFVKNGRYQGIKNQNGYDGFWGSDVANILVEVKTTDAYRINLDTIAKYAADLSIEFPDSSSNLGILIVVGRQDTGDLESQIRGSKYAWHMRVISVESLIDFAVIFDHIEDMETKSSLRKALLPFDYTRLDNLIKVISKATVEIERIADFQKEKEDVVVARPLENVPVDPIEGRRAIIIKSIQDKFNVKLIHKSKAIYQGNDGIFYIISVSKRYVGSEGNFWYALQDKWVDLFKENPNSLLILAMSDRDDYVQIPWNSFATILGELNLVQKNNGFYYQISICDNGGDLKLLMPRSVKTFSLQPYAIKSKS